MPHYLYVFLVAVGMGGITASANFALYLGEATGLSLKQYGTVGAVGLATTTVMIGFTGWLADRFHPIRVAMAGLFLQVFVATPLTLLWLFWHPNPETSYHLWLIITVAAMAPASALWTMLDPPLFMRIFPRDRYGQFCSANAIVRAVAIAIGGISLGVILDWLKHAFGERTARCCLPIWQLASFAIMLLGILLLYRSWKRHGGDKDYVPPIRTFQPLPLPIETLPA